MQTSESAHVDLSSGQELFALEHNAHMGTRGLDRRGDVFFYHGDEWVTYRWLVDRAGKTVEVATFRKS